MNGNRWVSANTNLPSLSLETPTSQSWFSGSSIPNRINTWSYDAAGNVTQVGGMDRHFTYDAENRQASFTINSTPSTYAYDGNGLRVKRDAGGVTTTYVYDAFGNLAAEYSSQAAPSACATQTCYPVLDHLGSTRMLTDANGSGTVTRYDYLPFGGELLASTNGRTTAMGYFASADGSNPKFTGKNRDNETGMDWFEIRHMSGAQGRFQSVDPSNAGAALGNPQTWNAYSYVANNPLSYTDPSGEGLWSILAGIGAGVATFFGSGGNVMAAVNVGAKVALIGSAIEGGRPPEIAGSGIPSLGSFTGCGGPLGNCGGGFGAGPWSEQSPVGADVQDPGRFIFNIDPNKIEGHHVFAQALRDWFEARQINIDRYLISLPAGLHRLKAFGGLHTGSEHWNRLWEQFRTANPNATREEVFDYAKQLIRRFGIGSFPGGTLEAVPLFYVDTCSILPSQPQCRYRGNSAIY